MNTTTYAVIVAVMVAVSAGLGYLVGSGTAPSAGQVVLTADQADECFTHLDRSSTAFDAVDGLEQPLTTTAGAIETILGGSRTGNLQIQVSDTRRWADALTDISDRLQLFDVARSIAVDAGDSCSDGLSGE